MILFQIAEISTLQKLELHKPKLDKSSVYIQMLKLVSSTSGVNGKFFSIKISLVGYKLFDFVY